MMAGDVLRYTLTTFRAHRLRLGLMLLATAIGVAAVILLASLGDSARRYVVDQFASLGTNLLIVFPGKSETTGPLPPVVGEAPRDLTIEDALALLRAPAVARIAPMNIGNAPVSWSRRERDSVIVGSTADFAILNDMQMARGDFLPRADAREAMPVAVIGSKIRDELFGTQEAIGQWLRIGDRRFRIIGIMAEQGTSLGMNRDEVVLIPVASAQQLFNTPSLFRILVQASSRERIPEAQQAITDILRDRHEGDEDVTVVTQNAVLAAFDRILGALTMTVAGIASISLLVAGVLIMNVMLVSVSQRRSEIGLLKAIGASSRQVLWLFLSEAAVLSLAGGLIGLVLGVLGDYALLWLYPTLPIAPPPWILVAALLVCMGSGMLFGVLPARRAARLDPVMALARR